MESFIQIIPDKDRDSDLEISVMISYFSLFSNIMAQAGFSGLNSLKRPNSGFLIINYPYYRNSMGGIESQFGTKEAFTVNLLFHELMHTLVQVYTSTFHPYNSTEYYSENQTFCSMTKYGKKFKFLITPYAHIFALKHYGVEVFEGDDNNCTSGIEIELSGGSGTSGSHVDFRPFFTEPIIGTDPERRGMDFNRITDVSMAILHDTGNYKCNWSVAKPLVWGNPESQIGGKFIKDFATGPPQLVFPKGYLLGSDDNYFYTGFDFKYIGSGYQTMKGNDCQNKDTEFCKGVKFFNPLNMTYVGLLSILDYQHFKGPDVTCPKGKAVLPGYTFYRFYETDCGYFKCNKYDNFTFYIENTTYIDDMPLNITCNKTNVGQQFNYTVNSDPQKYGAWGTFKRTAYCPDPELFCRTVTLHEMNFVRDPFDLDSKQLDDPYAKSREQITLELTLSGIVASVTFIVNCVIIGFIIFYKVRERKGSKGKSSSESIEEDSVPAQDHEQPDQNYLSD
ncbi:GP63-like [Trichomonas vaginalis G3]|uniref:GP63-like n=1 Tax=Trichomonas vaginalis (strain ATCC PRA-98 / G3) TaxID=412133 RepID=A2FE86_TRIV3|nr:regulation of choline O-acetyltransferase protein [Trichomonas vaginalis G3]EAX96777.1 GP63-like [Trichomonas vaginalis G3]KAI5552821.1 regulation of choline O-acetyltransferase protein [Trichomonas vaginalis G3]|eukprot:XP_001309707.1 GP63-like [Trichomonas vaginalis G3]